MLWSILFCTALVLVLGFAVRRLFALQSDNERLLHQWWDLHKAGLVLPPWKPRR